jgi:hypothetical protein
MFNRIGSGEFAYIRTGATVKASGASWSSVAAGYFPARASLAQAAEHLRNQGLPGMASVSQFGIPVLPDKQTFAARNRP